MTISYNKLWRMCIEHDMKETDVYKKKIVGKSTWEKLRANKNVSLSMIDALCKYFDCQPCDIMSLED